jgi:hypothetical protein
MTTAVQHRRGTTAEHSTFTGLEGEVTIDTTKDTAVIHDGVLAGGVPLARENLVNVTPSGLATITGASTASDDKFFIYDQSATTLKSITRAELNNAMEIDALANVTITGGTINGTTIGNTTAAAGTFTNLTATGTVTIPDNAISGDKVEGGTINAITINTLTATNNPTLSAGTANGVTYLNGSKVLTSGSALTFDGSALTLGGTQRINGTTTAGLVIASISGASSGFKLYNDSTTDTAYLINNYSGPMVFGVNNTEGMRLTPTSLYTASGINVGIGTSLPISKLTVLGAGTINAPETTTTGGSIQTASYGITTRTGNLELGATDALAANIGGSLSFSARYSGTNATWVTGKIGAYRDTATSGVASSYLAFATTTGAGDLTERLHLDSSGNLGLGVTPSAWISAYKGFDIGTTTSLYGRTDSTMEFALALNGYRASSGSWLYRNNGAAARYNQNSGTHWWDVAPSGTAGGTISFTQAMTLTAAGDLGVGQTSPGAKLELYSTANANFGQKIYHNSSSLGTHRFPQIEFAQTPVGQSYQNTVILRQQNSDYGNYPSLALITNAAGAGEATRMFVDGYTGNVGIGTTSASNRVSLKTTGGGCWLQTEDSVNTSGGNVNLFGSLGTGTAAIYTTGANPIGFYTNGSERARIDSDGLKFNGDTAAANALDDYEEGTWNIIVDYSGSTSGVTYNHRNGYYTKIGNVVTVQGEFQLSSKGTGSGVVRISLPLQNISARGGLAVGNTQSITVNNESREFLIEGGSSFFYIRYPSGAGSTTDMTYADIASSFYVVFAGTYMTA